MGKTLEPDPDYEELFLAGERVPAGRCRQIGKSRVVELGEPDSLPEPSDGQAACYQRVDCAWAQAAERVRASRAHRAA